MKIGKDIAARYPGVFLVHHNLPGKEVKKKNEDVHHLIIPIAGEISIECDGREFHLGPGKMIYIPCKSPHVFRSSQRGSGERLIAIIDQKQWAKVTDSIFSVSVLPAATLIKELILYLIFNPKIKRPEILLTTLIETLIEQIHVLGEEELSLDALGAKVSDPRLQKAISYLEARKRDNLKMVDLARVSGMSQRNFNRLFHEAFKITPKQLHSLLRMREAYQLLKLSKKSVTEVALEIGYSSLSQFTKAFHQTYRMLPSEI